MLKPQSTINFEIQQSPSSRLSISKDDINLQMKEGMKLITEGENEMSENDSLDD